ncbi:MAG: ABC transporter ATP-binding protein [Candidatus Hydrogenedentes bacterium]|nr:ABC transporter ATP-binding protein [Candidatus Hydrogenedentota bacterium]
MPPILSVNNVHFVRNHRQILNGVTWTIAPGEHWAILGANGSGKTTLLKIVTGYEWATEGSVEVLGERFGESDIRVLRKHVGWVSSSLEHRLPANDRAIDVVLSGLDASLGVYRSFDDSEKEAAHCALKSIGGEDLARKRYGVLSQGEQQRVLIARALVARPSILILDEPCAGLDPAARYRFLDDMGRLAQSSDAPALILVTHHIEEIGPWIGKVLVLKNGYVLKQGSPTTALTDEVLSDAFSIPCHVRKTTNTSWQLNIS